MQATHFHRFREMTDAAQRDCISRKQHGERRVKNSKLAEIAICASRKFSGLIDNIESVIALG
jgi:hypothetical protein